MCSMDVTILVKTNTWFYSSQFNVVGCGIRVLWTEMAFSSFQNALFPMHVHKMDSRLLFGYLNETHLSSFTPPFAQLLLEPKKY